MTSLELTLLLSDAVARRAEAEVLLTSEAVTRLIESELERRQQVQDLFVAADRLAALDLPPLSDVQVETEIRAVRNARRPWYERTHLSSLSPVTAI